MNETPAVAAPPACSSPLPPAHLAKLDVLARYIVEHGYGPTVRELALLFDLASTAGVNYYLHHWLELDLITVKWIGRRRIVGYTLRLTEKGEAMVARYRAGESLKKEAS